MITGRRSALEARCRERGYTLEDIKECIVHEDGDVVTVDERHPAYPREKPSLVTKAVNFVSASVAHVAAGAPRASDEEVARRFAICQACELYDGKACSKCGCPVVREQRYVSKLSWADQSCPVGKWGKTTDLLADGGHKAVEGLPS